MIFLRNINSNKYNTFLFVILNGSLFSETILRIKDHPRGQNINAKVNVTENVIFIKLTLKNKYDTSFLY